MLGLLTLVERKLVLKQGSKSSSVIEKKKNGEDVKAVDSWQKVFFHSTVLGNICIFSCTKPQFMEVQVLCITCQTNYLVCHVFILGCFFVLWPMNLWLYCRCNALLLSSFAVRIFWFIENCIHVLCLECLLYFWNINVNNTIILCWASAVVTVFLLRTYYLSI